MAKKITETMPELPKGLKPRHIHVLSAIAEHDNAETLMRVGDVSSSLKITMPSVTKLIDELAELDLIKKHTLAEDKRAIALSDGTWFPVLPVVFGALSRGTVTGIL